MLAQLEINCDEQDLPESGGKMHALSGILGISSGIGTEGHSVPSWLVPLRVN